MHFAMEGADKALGLVVGPRPSRGEHVVELSDSGNPSIVFNFEAGKARNEFTSEYKSVENTKQILADVMEPNSARKMTELGTTFLHDHSGRGDAQIDYMLAQRLHGNNDVEAPMVFSSQDLSCPLPGKSTVRDTGKHVLTGRITGNDMGPGTCPSGGPPFMTFAKNGPVHSERPAHIFHSQWEGNVGAQGDMYGGTPIASMYGDGRVGGRSRQPGLVNQGNRLRNVQVPHRYDGKDGDEWMEYLAYFDRISKWNSWSRPEMALQLSMSLVGYAQSVLFELPQMIQEDYDALCEALTVTFLPPERVSASRCEFRQRRRRPNETPTEFASALRRLATRAYAEMPPDAREIMLIEQLISGLSSMEAQRHVQFGHPRTLSLAVSLAEEYEAFESMARYNRPTSHIAMAAEYPRHSQEYQQFPQGPYACVSHDIRPNGGHKPQDLDEVCGVLQRVMDRLEALDTRVSRSCETRPNYNQCYNSQDGRRYQDHQYRVDGPPRCYKCGSTDHFVRSCPSWNDAANKQKN